MIITSIEEQKNPNRVNIFIDGVFAFGLEESIRFKHGLKSGMEIKADFIDNILKEEEGDKAFNSVLKYLAYRKRSQEEIIDHLKKQDFEEDIIEATIDKCSYYKYIDDLEFAKSFVKDKINLKKLGPNRIKMELKQKGISDEIIRQSLLMDQEDEYAMALALAEKRLGSYKNDDQMKKYSKLAGYLQRRGYSYSIISQVLKEVLNHD